MPELTNVLIKGSRDKPILVDIFYHDDQTPKPVVIFSHGFKGFKDWGHFNQLARRFAAEGLVFVKFNFSHNGTTTENPGEFEDLEAFGNNNYSIELSDLGLVIDWVFAFNAGSNLDLKRICLLGHSRGGGISIIKASEDKRVTRVCTWGSVADLVNRNKRKTVETWQQDGVVYTTNARTKQQMPLYFQFYEDILHNRDRFNIPKALRNISIPFLIVHGTHDDAVDVKEALQLKKGAKKAELLLVEGAGHTFGISHPFIETVFPGNAELVIFKTIEFYKS